MSFRNVKNISLKNVPTSKLFYYSIYRQQCGFSKEDIDREVDRRIFRMNFELVKRDFDIIQSRGNNLDNYTFDFSRGLIGTTESICRYIRPYHEDVYEQLSDFTFSELALASCHFSDFSFLYQLRDNVVKQELLKSMSAIHSKMKISDFRKEKVNRVVKLDRLKEENHNMMIYFNSISLCFNNVPFYSLNPFAFSREQKICTNAGSCISSNNVEEYKNLNNDVYHRDLNVVEQFPKMYIKR